MAPWDNRKLLRIGIVGSLVAAVCCFTPVLVALLSAVGLGGLVAGLDWVLLPVLLAFLCLTAFAWWRSRGTT